MANDGGSTSATAVYNFCFNLVLILSRVLCLAVCLAICLILYSLLNMISILPIILVMFYLAFIMDNSLGKLLYFSTNTLVSRNNKVWNTLMCLALGNTVVLKTKVSKNYSFFNVLETSTLTTFFLQN